MPSGCWCWRTGSGTRGSRSRWTRESTLAEAERRLPGLVARLQEEYGDGKGPDLLAEARAVVERSLHS